MDDKGLLIVISGPSGTGKGTLCKELLRKNPDIHISISATTRLARKGEKDGKSYFFVSQEKFNDMIDGDELLEHARVYDNYYGTPKKYVLEMLKKGKDVLLEIDTIGALQIKEKYRDGVFIFILPPSLMELENRITGRGTESKEDIKKRLAAAIEEIKRIKHYDYAVVNEHIRTAIDDIEAIIRAEKCKITRNIDAFDYLIKEG